MNLNNVVIAGRLTKDPELKVTPSGTQVASFSIATNRTWKDKNTGDKKEEVEFVNCVAWGRTAEVITQYFSKGKEIYIEGRLQTRSWEKDGRKNYRTEIVVSSFQFVGQNNKDSVAGTSYKEPSTGTAQIVDKSSTAPIYPEEIKSEDLPF